MSPKLSFIIPIYKPGPFFEKCLKSLMSQSLKDWEAIFVLDGPCPEIIAPIRRIMAEGSYFVVQIDHGGACRARNEGFKWAKGDYLLFWDCDCVIEPHAAKMWVDIFENEPEIGFIYSGYKFFDERGAINSEPFDPYTLRVRNYISTCFPLRRGLFPGWTESLLSLQDWDFWLSVVDKGGKGRFIDGHAFTTAFPTAESISGRGCTAENWLDRVDAVKKLHNLPERSICVSSRIHRADALAMAKFIDADYQDIPNHLPHRWKTIIQVGWSFVPDEAKIHARIFSEPHVKKILFWTGDDISEIYNRVAFKSLNDASIMLNACCAKQYVEDYTAKKLMEKAGFKVEVLQLPLPIGTEPPPMPEKPCFLVDISDDYGAMFNHLETSLPDVNMNLLSGASKIADYTGLIHFYPDRTTSNSLKRALLNSRVVISNVSAPFTGFVDDLQEPAKTIAQLVDRIRGEAKSNGNIPAMKYYQQVISNSRTRLLEAVA